MDHTFLVLRDTLSLPTILLGNDFLRANNSQIIYHKNKSVSLCINDQDVKCVKGIPDNSYFTECLKSNLPTLITRHQHPLHTHHHRLKMCKQNQPFLYFHPEIQCLFSNCLPLYQAVGLKKICKRIEMKELLKIYLLQPCTILINSIPNGNSSRLSIKISIFFIHSYAWLAGVR